jgi:hypothetical protein
MRAWLHRGATALRGLRPSLAVLVLASASPATARPVAEPTLALGVDSAYDSNVFNGRGPDLVNRITPHAGLEVHDERTDLKLGYDLGFWIYATGTADNSINHRALGSYEGRLTRRLRLRLADEFIYADDPGFLLRAGVVAPQTSILDNVAEGALAYRLTRRLDGELDYAYRHTSFGQPPPTYKAPLFNGDQHDAVALLTFRAGRLDDVRLSHRVSYFTVNRAGLAVENAPALGWRHQFVRDLEMRLEGGPVVYTTLEEAAQIQASALQGSGVSWRGAALLRFYTPRWRSMLAFTRDFVGGTGAGAVLWADYVTLSGGVHLEQKLDARLAVGYFANGFAPNGGRLYDGVTVDALVDWTIVPYLHLAAYYSFRWQEAFPATAAEQALAPLAEVTRHVIGLRLLGVYGLGARPPRRPRPGG